MLKYGGTLTLNNLIVYIAFNTDKGTPWDVSVVPRRWAFMAERYQLINLPTENLHSAIGAVAFTGTVQAPK